MFSSVGIHCQTCHKNFVNSNDQLIFQAMHDDLPGQDLIYNWELSIAGEVIFSYPSGKYYFHDVLSSHLTRNTTYIVDSNI